MAVVTGSPARQELLDEVEGLVRVRGPNDVEMRHGAKRHEVLDRFVRRAVFADADRVVRVDEHHAGLARARRVVSPVGRSH